MTQIYDGTVQVPVTVLEAGPCPVLQVKTIDKDGYNAIQIGFGSKKDKRASKAERNHAKSNGVATPRTIREVRCDGESEYKSGDVLDVSKFEEGQKIDIIGKTKGRGFQGVVKRHGFGGVGQATHGQHNRLRAPGSIGAASYPARVFKGMRMAGRMGGDTVKVQNLRVLKVVADKNLLVVKGCVPGHKNAYVTIQK